MADPVVAPPPVADAPPPPPPAAKAWHDGVDPELLGHIQTLGWHNKTGAEAAIEAAKAHREARSYIGMPETRLLKLPADPMKDPDAMKAVFQRLGAPKEAKEYDFANVKFSDGTAIDAAFDSALRSSLYESNIPKDAAVRIAQSVVKYFDDADKAEAADKTASIQESKANLAKNWGKNFDANVFIARQAAQKLGITPEAVDAMEKNVGYDKVMDAFLKIGLKTGEARYVAGENPAGDGVMTKDQAKDELAKLEKDDAFGKRLFAGDLAAKRQHDALLQLIWGAAA